MTVPFLYGGKEIGQLAATAAGDRTEIEVSVPRDDSGLFRGVLCCRRGEIPLGILEPQGSHLVLRRLLLAEEIRALGGAVSGEMRLSYAFYPSKWQPAASCGLFPSSFFQSRLQGREGALGRKERGLRLLALPFRIGDPFPMPDLFCFARILTIQHRTYAVFAFDGSDFPAMVPGEENSGKNENTSTISCTSML